MEQSRPIIRLATSNDADGICSLLNRVAPQYDRKINFWVWINRLLSEEKSIIAVAEFEGQIIGHYAIIPQKIIINNTEYRVGFGIHALIEDDKKSLVAIYEISGFAYKEAKKSGLKFVYGFPNQNYRLIQEKIERWKKVDLFKAYEIDIKDYSIESNSICHEISKLDTSFDAIFNVSKVLDSRNITSENSLKKSLNYYINRYLKHPHDLYESYLVKNEQGKMACIFLKKYTDINGETKGHLIDYIKENEFNYNTLMNTSISILKELNTEVISLWPINQKVKMFLDSKNVKQNGFETFFAIKFLDKTFEKEHGENLLNIKNWTLNMGDSDAF
ncbi:MAG: GNAT family N-acetyltransferase [Polaribacter sp.]